MLTAAALKDLLDPQTFSGAVFTTIIGATAVWALGNLGLWLLQLYRNHRSVEGRFSTFDLLEDTIHRRQFSAWPTTWELHEGESHIRFGVMSRAADLHLTAFNIRAVERARVFGYRNQAEPWTLEFTKLEIRQLESEQRGWAIGALVRVWHDGKSGFNCLLHDRNFALEKGTAFWFDITVKATAGWSGVLSFRANILDGPQLYCRRPLSVIADHNLITPSASHTASTRS